MSERVETRIPLKEPGKYKKVWGETQDEQVWKYLWKIIVYV